MLKDNPRYILFLNAKRLAGKMELFSSHQSTLDLCMCSNILHNEEDNVIVRHEVLEFCVGRGMT